MFCGAKSEPFGEERIFLLCFAKQNATAFAGAEDFPPMFCEAKSEPFGEERIFLLCFAEQNATAFAGADDFPPVFYIILLYATLSYLVAYVNHLSYI